MSEIKKILIANRGVCACRIIKTCVKMNIDFVTIFTSDDLQSLHVKESKESYPVKSYLDIDDIIRTARKCNATAIHPGYGFQSENYLFAEKCSEAGIIFIGPTADNMKKFSQKHIAKEIAKGIGRKLTTVPSSDLVSSVDEASQWAKQIGYPVMLKLTAGGGGIGIHICKDEPELRKRFETCRSQGVKFFGCGELYIEKYIQGARHVEVQVFGDGKGVVIHLGERECSVQRRHQKVIEEAPCPALSEELRASVCDMAVRLCQAINYKSAGTVEFLFDEKNKQFYFMEMNTRLQVEHRVTELLYNVDLVELMIQTASPSNNVNLDEVFQKPRGHAIECRIHAEDPLKDFKPSPGVVTEVVLPKETPGLTCVIDYGVYRGCKISPCYDALLANIVQWGPTRSVAAQEMAKSLKNTLFSGPVNNLDYVTEFVESQDFILANTCTDILETFVFRPRCVEVLSSGLLTTVQDWPGRTRRGLWRIGVPPSGPMDHLACRIANRLVGNHESSSVLEITVSGPTLKFHCDAKVALTGASMELSLDGKAIPMWSCIAVESGTVLRIGSLNTKLGSRAYLGVAGGFDVQEYLGSRSTFPNGHLGGYQGRPLSFGDVIKLGKPNSSPGHEELPGTLDVAPVTAEYSEEWEIGVLPGPHANPDFLTDDDIEMFYSTKWEVHHNSNRLGIRLIGPAPEWSRDSGGEGGSHPSNIHDCEYAVGTVNFTGNMPIIIAQDGPSLGGFVCPSTIVQSELWKIGQVKAGDTIKFRKMTIKDAVHKRLEQSKFINNLNAVKQDSLPLSLPDHFPTTRAVLHEILPSKEHPGAKIRLAGDSYILVEYGAMVLDLNLRFRVHFLEQWLLNREIAGLEETAPGVRSLQIRYDPIILPLVDLVQIVIQADGELHDISHLSISTRVFHLPMCFNNSGVDEAITRYMKSVRPIAPYLPSNIEYTAKNNGLKGPKDVKDKVFSASYMCLGLGDVYLGACCAVPVNPLHRLVTTKYNPARTFTQEGTVGLGGSYMCIYPMDSPGGYQLIGRTLPIWDTFAVGNPSLFSRDKPWLLEMFDQIRFVEVTEPELDRLRREFSAGRLEIEVKTEEFHIAKYNVFLKSIADETKSYREIQEAAASAMLQEEEKSLKELKHREAMNGKNLESCHGNNSATCIPPGCLGVRATVTGNVWKINAAVGDNVFQDQPLAIVEAMKMECDCNSPINGVLFSVLVAVGQLVHQGELLMLVNAQQDVAVKQ